MFTVMRNCMTEFHLEAGKPHADPFNEIEVDVVFADPDGTERTAPAFWSGGNLWRARFASPIIGRHTFRTVCSDASDSGLHGREGCIEVIPYDGDNPLLARGPLRVAADRPRLEHLDGTPFFWLADTWWMALCKRLRWPDEFQLLAADRTAKGFTVVQLVAGLYPDMPPFDERGANEAGQSWEEGFARINPDYFDLADLRVARLVHSGLVPCIVGCWGYYIWFAGVQALKKHWRYLVARWWAHPVVWCVAGEVLMSWYLRKDLHEDPEKAKAFEAQTRADWQEVARYLRSVDPAGHPVTAHPGGRGSREILGDDLVEIEWLQTGHSGWESVENTIRQVTESVAHEPRMPVINSEVSYEGIGEGCRQEVQRFMFWSCMLSGAAGHSYGANGIWQFNRPGEPFGPSPHGMTWGNTPWQEAYRLPGSANLGLGKRLLERYEWWRLKPCPESVEPHWTHGDYLQPYAAEIPGQCRIVYIPRPIGGKGLLVKGLSADAACRAFYFDPATGTEYELPGAKADEQGHWQAPAAPIFQDWVLVVEQS